MCYYTRMAENRGLRLFGSELRTKILIYLTLLGETYAGELATLIKVSRVTVYRALEDLEREGYVSSAISGRERWVRLNPHNAVCQPLTDLLTRLGESRPQILAEMTKLRRRPRRRGKELGTEP